MLLILDLFQLEQTLCTPAHSAQNDVVGECEILHRLQRVYWSVNYIFFECLLKNERALYSSVTLRHPLQIREYQVN